MNIIKNNLFYSEVLPQEVTNQLLKEQGYLCFQGRSIHSKEEKTSKGRLSLFSLLYFSHLGSQKLAHSTDKQKLATIITKISSKRQKKEHALKKWQRTLLRIKNFLLHFKWRTSCELAHEILKSLEHSNNVESSSSSRTETSTQNFTTTKQLSPSPKAGKSTPKQPAWHKEFTKEQAKLIEEVINNLTDPSFYKREDKRKKLWNYKQQIDNTFKTMHPFSILANLPPTTIEKMRKKDNIKIGWTGYFALKALGVDLPTTQTTLWNVFLCVKRMKIKNEHKKSPLSSQEIEWLRWKVGPKFWKELLDNSAFKKWILSHLSKIDPITL